MTSSTPSAIAHSGLIAAKSEPVFIYDTGGKREETKDLVEEALKVGFRHFDTAALPKRYQERLVGEAIRAWLKAGGSRKDIYIQTKYIAPAGQDLSNMPYNPYEPLEFQIRNSVAYSLWNLRPVEDTDDESYIDCFLLHSPLPTIDQTIQAWSILQTYVPDKIRTLGISHVSLPTLEALYQASTIKPTVVQNRFRPKTGYDVPLRAFCREHDISYQSFWTLTANAYSLLKSAPVMELANAVGVSTAVALYALIVDLGIVVLNGTTLSEHLREDLSGVAKVRDWAMDSEREWETMRVAFARLVGEPT